MPDAMTGPLVRLREVSRTYGHDARAVVALHGVSCDIDAGARIAVVGPSGSGKSTFVQLLAGLDRPTRGSIDWAGLGGPPQDDPTRVGVVFQGPSLVPALTAEENVALPLVLRGTAHREAQECARAHLRRVGVEAVAHQLPDELSGGQAQRVAVARVLALRPRLILADEPTGKLDQSAGRRVVEVLLETADELGAALLVTTHDPHVVSRLGTRWRMHDGALDLLPDVVAGEPR